MLEGELRFFADNVKLLVLLVTSGEVKLGLSANFIFFVLAAVNLSHYWPVCCEHLPDETYRQRVRQ